VLSKLYISHLNYPVNEGNLGSFFFGRLPFSNNIVFKKMMQKLAKIGKNDTKWENLYGGKIMV
jgi:hypothetical protein